VNRVLVTSAGAVVADLVAIAVLSGGAIAHVVHLYHHLEVRMAGRPFEVEVSVDETESPTTNAQHVYMAHELRRLGVRWVSLALRYIGAFEKGVDYLGDVSSFEADLSIHAAIARTATLEGTYKLSLHSGSDKVTLTRSLSILPSFARRSSTPDGRVVDHLISRLESFSSVVG